MAVTPYKQLEQEWQRLHAFRGALSLLRWDAAVMMPRGSADVPGEQLAAIETEQHAVVTSHLNASRSTSSDTCWLSSRVGVNTSA